MDTERVQCPQCQTRFDMDQGASATTCPSCGRAMNVRRSDHARVLVPVDITVVSGGDGTGCLIFILILLAIYAIGAGQLP